MFHFVATPQVGLPPTVEETAELKTDLGTCIVIKEAGDELCTVLGILIVSSVHAAYLRHYNARHRLDFTFSKTIKQ